MLKLSILSPEKRVLEGAPVEEVTLNGSEGQIQILPGHAAMVGTLEAGEFQYRNSSGQRAGGVIASGFFEAESLELRGDLGAAEAGAGHA